VVEVETLYGTVVHKLVETVQKLKDVERAEKRKMWIVIPNPQAVIYLPLLLRTRRELRKEHDVEFYTLDVTSRGLVRLTDVASMLVKKWKETTEGAEEGRCHAVKFHGHRLRIPDRYMSCVAYMNSDDIYLTCQPLAHFSK
jgi:hypothetical protein